MNFNAPSTRFASIAVLVSAAIWGLYWVPLRYLEGLGVAEAWTVALINLPAAAVMGAIVLYQFKQQRPFLGRGIVIGVFMGLTVAMFTIGLVYSSVVRVTLLFYLTPIWSTLVGMFWLGEPTSRSRWIAIATGLLGLGFLIAKGGSQIPLNIGDFYGFASGVTWAFGGALIKRHGEVPMPTLTFFQFLFAAVFALILGGLSGLAPVPSAQLLVQVLPTAIATSFIVILPTMFIIFWAQKFLFPGRVGLLMMTEVIVAILTASIFLPEEAMNTLEWIGAALIIGACLVEILTPGKAKAA